MRASQIRYVGVILRQLPLCPFSIVLGCTRGQHPAPGAPRVNAGHRTMAQQRRQLPSKLCRTPAPAPLATPSVSRVAPNLAAGCPPNPSQPTRRRATGVTEGVVRTAGRYLKESPLWRKRCTSWLEPLSEDEGSCARRDRMAAGHSRLAAIQRARDTGPCRTPVSLLTSSCLLVPLRGQQLPRGPNPASTQSPPLTGWVAEKALDSKP